MNKLSSTEVDCMSCDGHCCSYRSNSMQITPIEALDLYQYLHDKGRWTYELKVDLQKCIEEFRLDKELSTGKNTTFRRTYTCPFYTPGAKGCSISPESKPYGCLAFNPRIKNSDGEDCASDLNLLEQREKDFQVDEDQLNLELKDRYSLWWDKLPIPMALLELEKQLLKNKIEEK